MKRIMSKGLIVLLSVMLGLNLTPITSAFAITLAKNEELTDGLVEDVNQIQGNYIKVENPTEEIENPTENETSLETTQDPTFTTETQDDIFIEENQASQFALLSNDITSYIDLTSLKAWINGSVVYEKDSTMKLPDSIYNGTSFKLELKWKVKDSVTEPLKENDTFTLEIGTIAGLGYPLEKEEILAIDNIPVGKSYFRYVDHKLSYTIEFNENITYFESVQGQAANSSTFNQVTTGEKVAIDFTTGGTGEIVVIEKPVIPPSGSGDVGVGLPDIVALPKELITIGKSTFTSEIDKQTFGWRVVFTDLIHKNQQDLTNITNPIYTEDLIIEDTLDENHVFSSEIEYGYGGPFFLDIPLMLPNTQSAIAYTSSDITKRISAVKALGNGNSDYVIKPNKFTKYSTEAEVRANPLSYAIVEIDNRQKLIINAGKLGTTDATQGITTDLIDFRYPDRNPKPISDLAAIIDDELVKYEKVINHGYSPRTVLIEKYEKFKQLYNPSTADLATYDIALTLYLNTNLNPELEPIDNPPGIPDSLMLPTVINLKDYLAFEKAILDFKANMKTYAEKMDVNDEYRKSLDSVIQGLMDAKTYYATQGNRIYGFCLKYKTEITNSSPQTISNDVKISTGTSVYEDSVKVDHTYSSGISGVFAKGDIVILKADEAMGYVESQMTTSNTLKGIKGVSFEVFDKDTNKKLYFIDKAVNSNQAYTYYAKEETGKNITSTLVTDVNGKIIISGLSPAHEHYLKEVVSPTGYYSNQNQEITFTIDSKKVNYKLIENTSRMVTFKKVDQIAESKGEPSELQGAVFAIYDQHDQEIKHFKEEVINGKSYYTHTNLAEDNDKLTTLADGTLTVKNLPAGNYYFKEIEAPSGYILSSDSIFFELTEQIKNGVTVVDGGKVANLKSADSITLTKIDEDTLNPIEGTSFELYKRNSGSNWTQGTHSDWTQITQEQYNKNGSYVTSQQLDGNALKTGKNGQLSIGSLPQGDYYFKEVNASDGYLLNSRHLHFTITNMLEAGKLFVSQTSNENVMEQVVNNLVTNKKGAGSIKIIKFDLDQGASITIDGMLQPLDQVYNESANTIVSVQKPLTGVEFDLYRQESETINMNTDTKIATGLSTDIHGEIKVSDLTLGTYYFIETKTLSDYVLKQDPIVFEVKHQDVQEGSTTLVQLVNNVSVDYRIVVKKVDKETSNVLKGAQFELYDSANHQLKFIYNEQAKAYQISSSGTAVLETNNQGEIVIKNLLSLQKYSLKETKAPEGYVINPEFHSYEIFINLANDSLVPNGLSLTNVVCENEKIPTPSSTPTTTSIPSATPTVIPTHVASPSSVPASTAPDGSVTPETTITKAVGTGDKTTILPLVFLLVVGVSGILFVWIKKKNKK